MKTAELQGAALDWAVAKAEGYGFDVSEDGYVLTGHDIWDADGLCHAEIFIPSESWAHGGPIIERNIIGVYADPSDGWRARSFGDAIYYAGKTPLIAAMRCYVASKLGEEVEIPTELEAIHA